MTKSTEDLGLCPACRKGRLMAAQYTRRFELKGKPVEVKLQTSECAACGEMTTKASQHRENLRALAERKAHYGNVLMGEEILALRKRYGLTQQQASTIFGKGKIAFSRYESETSYPDESTTRLLTLAIEKAEVMKCLADKAGVDLPLWPERCEDDRGVKLRLIPGGRTSTTTTHKQNMQPDFSPGPFAASVLLSPVRPVVFPAASNDSVDLLEVVAS